MNCRNSDYEHNAYDFCRGYDKIIGLTFRLYSQRIGHFLMDHRIENLQYGLNSTLWLLWKTSTPHSRGHPTEVSHPRHERSTYNATLPFSVTVAS